jgi:hypothetical protein
MSVTSQDISSATFAAITGVTKTVTPNIDSRVSIVANVRCNATAYDGKDLFVKLLINGTEVAFGIFNPGVVGGKSSICLLQTQILTKETTYTFTMEAALSAAGSTTYRINQAGVIGTARATGMLLSFVPKLHAP